MAHYIDKDALVAVPKYAVKKAVDNTLAQVKDKVKVLIIKEGEQ